jgi:LysM repeat protein
MTEEETIRTLPDRPSRHCPECGARVGDSATTCLICGTDLTRDGGDGAEGLGKPADDAGERSQGLGTLQHLLASRAARITLLSIIAIGILTGAVILGMNLAEDDVLQELPTFTPTATETPTVTPSPTLTPTPTDTPLPTATPTPIPPIEYVVQAGDTLLDIAIAYDLSIDEITTYNQLDSDIIVEGQTLLIPPPTPTPGPTPTSVPGQATETPAAFILHTVRAGETLSNIAEEYGITVSSLRAANDIPEDSESILPDQVLTIPRNTPTPEPESISPVELTPTPGITTYQAPPMLSPLDGAVFTGPDAVIALHWVSVGILQDREYYEVELIVPTEEGSRSVSDRVRATVWRLPTDLFPTDDVENRVFSWRVAVVRQVTEEEDAAYKIISQTNRRRSFTWMMSESTP